MARRRSDHWSKTVNWDQRDYDIARQVGVTKERVRQVRLSLGLMPSGKMQQIIDRMFLLLNSDRFTVTELAQRTGRSRSWVNTTLRRYGVKPKQARRGRTGPRPKERKYDWDSITRKQWETLTSRQIAKLLGVHDSAIVVGWRTRHKLPRGPRGWRKERNDD